MRLLKRHKNSFLILDYATFYEKYFYPPISASESGTFGPGILFPSFIKSTIHKLLMEIHMHVNSSVLQRLVSVSKNYLIESSSEDPLWSSGHDTRLPNGSTYAGSNPRLGECF